ncbi:helix-turn-helix domain-containing protein [Streptomyces sp. NPDC058257]|uniref:helix-turn-helix domain-containing protein n=1 Tax=Streptomyces sp. NPDC058257 TaxID=3346409 RepID=UPI0036F0E97C
MAGRLAVDPDRGPQYFHLGGLTHRTTVSGIGVPGRESGKTWRGTFLPRASIGYEMLVDAGLSVLREADTVVVPGWQPIGAPVPPDVTAAAYAARIARNMVLPPHREGSRLQYAARQAEAAPARADEPVAPLLEWAAARLDAPLTLGGLAEHAGLSGRTLARRFTEQLGTSPGQWLLGRRLDAARALLEQTDLPVEAVAARVGLASAVNLRRRFRARLGTTPGAYRRAFGETAQRSSRRSGRRVERWKTY